MVAANPASGQWSFWMPLTKAVLEPIRTREGDERQARVIEGVASTEAWDEQGQSVDQYGLDFDYFLAKGWFNWNHSTRPEDIIGAPSEADIRRLDGKDLFFVKGYLLEPADHDSEQWMTVQRVWSLMKSLESLPIPRRLGMSVQGSTLQMRGERITKAQVRMVAITPEPVNTETWAKLAKSMSATAVAPLLREDLDTQLTSLLYGDNSGGKGCGHFDPTTLRFRSSRAVAEHLVKCLGHSPESATRSVRMLRGFLAWRTT